MKAALTFAEAVARKAAASLAGKKRYFGRLCDLHPAIDGERLIKNSKCVECHKAAVKRSNDRKKPMAANQSFDIYQLSNGCFVKSGAGHMAHRAYKHELYRTLPSERKDLTGVVSDTLSKDRLDAMRHETRLICQLHGVAIMPYGRAFLLTNGKVSRVYADLAGIATRIKETFTC